MKSETHLELEGPSGIIEAKVLTLCTGTALSGGGR